MRKNLVDIALYAVGMLAILTILLPYSPMTIDWLLLPRDIQINVYLHRHLLWTIGIACLALVFARAFLAAAGQRSWPLPAALLSRLQRLVGVAEPVWLKITVITAAGLVVTFWSGYVPYVMTPPTSHQLLSAAEADKLMSSNDIVLGFVHRGEARAYPRDFISRPHFFPDTVAGEPVTISYCILCNSAIAFKPELHGHPLKLQALTAYNNNIIYYDRNRGDFIQQLDGKVVYGPDTGEKLEELPVVLATWGAWKTLHPDTKVYYAPPITIRDKLVAAMLQMMVPVSKLAKRATPFHRVRGNLDERLPAMSFVYGVELNGDSCAYSEAYLAKDQVVNDTVGGEPILILYDAREHFGNVYLRRIGGQTLTFARQPNGSNGVLAKDAESGSGWDVDGVARDGKFTGQSLEPIPHFNRLFWFSWALFKPGTRLKTASGVMPVKSE